MLVMISRGQNYFRPSAPIFWVFNMGQHVDDSFATLTDFSSFYHGSTCWRLLCDPSAPILLSFQHGSTCWRLVCDPYRFSESLTWVNMLMIRLRPFSSAKKVFDHLAKWAVQWLVMTWSYDHLLRHHGMIRPDWKLRGRRRVHLHTHRIASN